MKREQIERGAYIIDKLDALDKAISSLISSIGNNQGITLSASFTGKFKDELIEWMNAEKTRLEKDLEQI